MSFIQFPAHKLAACAALFVTIHASSLAAGSNSSSIASGELPNDSDDAYCELQGMMVEVLIVLTTFGAGTYIYDLTTRPASPRLRKAQLAAKVDVPAVAAEQGAQALDSALIAAASQGDLEQCERLCGSMRTRGVLPSTDAFAAVLEACLTERNTGRACSAIGAVSDAAHPQRHLVAGPQASSAAAARSAGLAAQGNFQEASVVLKEAGSFAGLRPPPPAVAAARLLLRRLEQEVSSRPPPGLTLGDAAVEMMVLGDATGTLARDACERAVRRRLNQFIEVNGLDQRCAHLLRRLSSAQAEWVMDQEFIIDVDPTKGTASAKVVHAVCSCKAKTKDFWDAYPSALDLRKRLATFAKLNDLDDRCVTTLQKMPLARIRQVMDAEFLVVADATRGTASAKVVGRIVTASKV
eukprot:TRINITY_DN73295_c0_g1_i1.p1 TRINITY_DN73295_c0_g1~~TRINITY_DN73295_c0_g1_i1.p1  ORF type:complete len:409 (+),score=91.41 TRINITY_DN73295_c0_g1_i1:106-1332(+)